MRTSRLLVLALAGILVLGLGAAAVWLARPDADRLPPRVAIEGRELGGLTLEEARGEVRAAAHARIERPIDLVAPDASFETSGEELGAEPAVEQALEDARTARGALSRLAARLGLVETTHVPLEYSLDDEAVGSVLDSVAEEVEQDPVSAGVELVGGRPEVQEPEDGVVLDRRRASARLERLPTRVELPLRTSEPAVSADEAEQARDVAASLLDDPPLVVAQGLRAELRPRDVRRALRFRARNGEIEVSLAAGEIEGRLRAGLGELEREPRSATFRIRGEKVRVVGSRDGRGLDLERIGADLVRRHDARRVRARFARLEPQLTTAEARALRIRRLVSEFTTEYTCCQPRVTNIQRAAQILDGQIVEAGARFSLNEALGERTPERGFVSAPMILAGRLVDSVGGGVSQIATTVYNAAFFAGVDLVAHSPHQFYISRYPMGREATVSWGGPELIFENDWPAAILIKAEAGSTSVTFRFYSERLGRRVETETGAPRDFRPPRTREVRDSSLAPDEREVVQQAGGSGFTVTYTRRVYRRDELIKDERWTVTYEPQNRIVLVGPSRTG